MSNRNLVGLAVAAAVGLSVLPALADGNPCYKASNDPYDPEYLRLAFKEFYPLTQPAEVGVRKKMTYSVAGLAGPGGEPRSVVGGSIVVMRKLGAKVARALMGLTSADYAGSTSFLCFGYNSLTTLEPSASPAPRRWDCQVNSNYRQQVLVYKKVEQPASDPKCGLDNI